jgi:cell division septation protein DedD
MVKISNEIKNPKTPEDNNINEIKNSLGRKSTFHDANTPANTTIDVSAIIATEIPSTPTV